MSEVFFKYKSNSMASIYTEDILLFNDIRNAFTVEDKSIIFKRKKGYKLSEMYCPITLLGTYPTGLTFNIMSYLLKTPGHKLNFDEKLKESLGILKNPKSIVYPSNEITYRNIQLESLKCSLNINRGIFQLPTSSGKSLIIYGLIQSLFQWNPLIKTCLIYVPNIQLVTQMEKDLLQYGMNPNEIQSFSSFNKVINPNVKVVISNRQWLEKHSKELPEIGILIVDECHTLKKGSKTLKFINSFNTQIRFGLTGTLPESLIDKYNVIGAIGPVLISKYAYELEPEKILAVLNIKCIRLNYQTKPHIQYPSKLMNNDSTDNMDLYLKAYQEELAFFENDSNTLKFIVSFIDKLKGNTLVLFDHTEHGQNLHTMIQNTNKHFINGETKLANREYSRLLMEDSKNMIIIANQKCFGTGINIKNIHNILLIVSGKSQTKVIQSIGRGLRTCSTKTELNLYDVHCNLKYSEKHFAKRKQLYLKHYNQNINQFSTFSL